MEVFTGKPLSALAVSRAAFGAIDLFQIAFDFPTYAVGRGIVTPLKNILSTIPIIHLIHLGTNPKFQISAEKK